MIYRKIQITTRITRSSSIVESCANWDRDLQNRISVQDCASKEAQEQYMKEKKEDLWRMYVRSLGKGVSADGSKKGTEGS